MVEDNKSAAGALDIQNWLDAEQLQAVTYSDYWNDAEAEKNKELNPDVAGFSGVEEYFKSIGLVDAFDACIETLRKTGVAIEGRGCSLAAGNLWDLPQIFAKIKVEHITCVEFSRHRLLAYGPRFIEQYKIPTDRVTLALGSFYELHLANGSLDFAIFCQALHHADHPLLLLKEVSRVLRPGGFVIVTGEPVVNVSLHQRLRHVAKYVVYSILGGRWKAKRPNRTFARTEDFFPPDPVLGDHFHTRADYRRMFNAAGYDLQFVDVGLPTSQSMIAIKRS